MENPLAKYLAAAGLSQKAFADDLPARQATISGWCNDTIPSIPDAARIERATGGAVRVNDWADYASHIGVYTRPRIARKIDGQKKPSRSAGRAA